MNKEKVSDKSIVISRNSKTTIGKKPFWKYMFSFLFIKRLHFNSELQQRILKKR